MQGGHFAYGHNSHCPQLLPQQPFLMNVSRHGQVKKLKYWHDIGLILLKFRTGGNFELSILNQ